MPDPFDVYADQFAMNLSPYGTTLNFSISSAIPAAPGTTPQSERVATIRMSLEHLKVMSFIIRRQIMQYEQQTGVRIQVPVEVLNSLHISREDWDAIWK
jgi:hypothetical protein